MKLERTKPRKMKVGMLETELAHFTLGATTVLFRIIIQTSS